MIRCFVISCALVIILSCNDGRVYRMKSPGKELVAQLQVLNDSIYFNLKTASGYLLLNSGIGAQHDNEKISLVETSERTEDYTWESINGKNKIIRNNFREYKFSFKTEGKSELNYSILFRLYDEGLAFRYNFNNASGKNISPPYDRLNFPGDPVFWSYNGENHNIGPENLSGTKYKTIRPPAVFKIATDKYCAVLEAAIMDHAPFILQSHGSEYSVSIEVLQDRWQLPAESSWRVIQVSDSPGKLVESDILLNLNRECQIEDPAWIKPGKVMWDWRVWGYRAPDGFEYGLDTPSHKRLVDFASENNIQYILLDADWYGPEFSNESDPTSASNRIDIEEFMEYTGKKNIGVILYLNDIGARKFGLDNVLKQFAEWGASGVKYGFMSGTWKEKVIQTRKVVELCAKYRLMVNFHDNPVPPSGDSRTWPNLLAREFCHSQADAHRSYYPETAVTSVFVNMLAGPLDMCDGWFDLNNAHSRVKVFEKIPGTVAAELAKILVYHSGWHVLPDAPEEYMEKYDLFRFIKELPVSFDNYRVLEGSIGENISVARKSGNTWYMGSLTNRAGRTTELKLDFLDSEKNYLASIFEDTEATHFLENKEEYNIRFSDTLNYLSTIKLTLAPGGGCAVILKPVNIE